MNRKLYLGLIACGIICSSCNGGNTSSSANPVQPKITINQVEISKLPGDFEVAANFSTKITLTYQGEDTTDWMFGFYMPRTFNTLTTDGTNINPNLFMQICDMSTDSCSDLHFLREKSGTGIDLGAGYTNFLNSRIPFKLVTGKQDVLNLLHNNQWEPMNYSAVPQNFALITNSGVAIATPGEEIYKLPDYDSAKIKQAIDGTMASNWSNSNSQTFQSVIVPSPVTVINNGFGDYSLNKVSVIHNRLSTNDDHVAQFYKDALQQDLHLHTVIDHDFSASDGIVIEPFTGGVHLAIILRRTR